ncbi:GGDEF domain-containing protein [Lysobacter niastensis]|uniref:diguanylate cyclase n=1 Tax=Lysobacter niastensis TaxID=380629 RepID=A0ABS0B4G2_9GAMM|nr:diguanylate cyclase [Lysobacter niastensis]MBF6023515.1 diguanylate cyclase [Lysobacter niastensis]
MARLDADPVPAEVLTGALDNQFSDVEGQTIFETSRQPRWWRLVATRDIPAADDPQLLLMAPYLNEAEVWTPGEPLPVRRALYGPAADDAVSTRALVVALPRGVVAGEPIYLRVRAPTTLPMPVSVESMADVHRKDLTHVALRTAVLATMAVLAFLAVGFRVGVGETSYTYLLLTLIAQIGYLSLTGGELRMSPVLADLIGSDPRIGRLLGLIALLASTHFLAFYLNLSERQPRLMRLVEVCSAAMGLLLLVSLATPSEMVGGIANLVLLVVTGTLFLASVVGCIERQRSAFFVLLSWLPMFALAVWRVGELQEWWPVSPWMQYAFPASFAGAGLVLMVGLTDKMQQLRRDRDRASQMATYDKLTGALSRVAIEERLRDAIDDAHAQRRRLSIVFFDIDRFKQINDQHGHRVGDEFLRIIVLRARNRLRVYDMCGRYGGDEILVILPDTGLGEAMGVAENLRSAIDSRPLSIDGGLFEASLSIGVAELRQGEGMSALIERADGALYASKAAGRNRVSSGHAVATA